MSGPSWRSAPFDFCAAPRSCSRSKVPTFGISLSMINLRSAISFLPHSNTHRKTIIPRRLPWITSSAWGREPLLYASDKLISPSPVTLVEGRRWAQRCPQAPPIACRKAKVLHQVNQLVAQSKIRRHPVDRELRKVTTWSKNLVITTPQEGHPESECGVQHQCLSEASDAAGPPATPRWRQLPSLCAPGAGPSARRPAFERLQYPLQLLGWRSIHVHGPVEMPHD